MINKRAGKIFFRADGNETMGLGHIVRSSALASALKTNYDCILVTRCKIPEVLTDATAVYDAIIQLPETDFYSEATSASSIFANADLVVLDGYSFDATYQKELIRQKFDFFSIDDTHATTFYSKAIINHSGGLNALNYDARPGTQFYLGPQYSLLRKPFLNAARKRRVKLDNKNCLVCFGGADPFNKTLEILKNANIRNHFDQFHVVTGSAYRYQEELLEFTMPMKNVLTYSSLSAEELVSVMKECCFAICSPSTFVYEYMSVGGGVFLEQIADNQKDVIKYMLRDNLAFSVNEIDHVGDVEINLSLENQCKYFDGRSDERLVRIFDQYFYAKKIEVRRAAERDLMKCFEWATDIIVRGRSFNQNTISLQEHSEWFHQKIRDPNCFFYILEIDKEPIAQIRFQVADRETVIGYLVDEEMRNKGLGTSVLSLGIERFIRDFQKPGYIVGYVKNSNLPSQRSFEKLAFAKEDGNKFPDSFKYVMRYGN